MPSPVSALEDALEAGRRGTLSLEEVLGVLLGSSVVVPSAGEVGDDFAGFVPVIFDRDGTQMLAVFSDPSRASAVAHVAGFAVSMPVGDLVAFMRRDHGIVLNPGHELGLEILPDVVDALRRAARGRAGTA